MWLESFTSFESKEERKSFQLKPVFVLASSHRVRKLHPSKTRFIKSLEVNAETRFGDQSLSFCTANLKLPPGKQGQECQFPPSTALHCPTDAEHHQDHAA